MRLNYVLLFLLLTLQLNISAKKYDDGSGFPAEALFKLKQNFGAIHFNYEDQTKGQLQKGPLLCPALKLHNQPASISNLKQFSPATRVHAFSCDAYAVFPLSEIIEILYTKHFFW